MSCKATLADLVEAVAKNMSAVDLAQTTLHIEISHMIRNARKKLDLSQQALAKKMGVKQSMVSRWESGECNYTIDTLVEIADALRLSVQCPLTFDEVSITSQPIQLRTANKRTTIEENTVFSKMIQFDPQKILDGGAA